MIVRVVGRALEIHALVVIWAAPWIAHGRGLRWLVWRLTGGGEPHRRLRNEAMQREACEAMGRP